MTYDRARPAPPTATTAPPPGARARPGDPASILVAGRLVVDAADRDRYLRSCEPVVRAARAADGCLDFALSADLVDPTRVDVYERWRARAALDDFRREGPDDDRTSSLVEIDVAEYTVRPSGSGP